MNTSTNRDDSTIPSSSRERTFLRAFLRTEDYSFHAIEAVVTYFDRHGCLEGCPELEAEDRAEAYDWIEGCSLAVPQTSHAWGSPSGLESPRNPLDDCWETVKDVYYTDAAEFAHNYSMGTGPDTEQYEPTDSDWAELEAWSESLDEGMAFPRERTRAEKLEAADEIIRTWVENERD